MVDPKKLINHLKIELEENPSVKAFVLVGSQAREDVYKATKYSDMEAYIIADDKNVSAVEKQLPEILNKYTQILFWFKHAIGFVAVDSDLFRIELPVIKESGLEGLFCRPKAQLVKVLIDRTEGRLEKILAKRPEKIEHEEEFKNWVVNFWHWQIIGVQYFKKGELYNARSILNTHASVLIKLFELYNDPGILLLESRKRVEQFLTLEQLEKLKTVTPSYDRTSIKRALIRVMEIMPIVFSEISEKYKYEYDNSLGKRVKVKLSELLE